MPHKGYKQTKEHREALKVPRKGSGIYKRTSEMKTGKYEHTSKHKINYSKAMKGKPAWNKGLTKEMDERVGRYAIKRRGMKFSEEHIKNLRLARIKDVERKNGVVYPNFNPKACEFFKSFDMLFNTKGQYAMYGGGEYYIERLGYFPDYFNLTLKLIMEWDEPNHYENGRLKEKDKIRQKEIQELYPEFEFVRVRQ